MFGSDFILTTMTANSSLIQEKPEVVLNFCKALKETIDYVRDPRNEAPVAAFLGTYMNLSAPDAATMVGIYKDNFTARLTPARWAALKALNNDAPPFETQVYQPCADISAQ